MPNENQDTSFTPPRKAVVRKKMVVAALAGFGALAITLVARTATFRSKQVFPEAATEISIDGDLCSRHLAEAVRIATISHQDPAQFDAEAFRGFHGFLEAAFPLVHARLDRQVIGEYSLLYTWKGSDEGREPILLMGHIDVVPVEPGTQADWEHPPFSGEIADGYIWGRGTLDDKSSVLGLLEAAELLLREGRQPQRTIYLAFGHDEEVSGANGAAQIAERLERQGVELAYVLDEGMSVTNGLVPGIATPVALIGIAEKGYVSVELTVETEGGHSSMPPAQSAVGILSAAVQRLEAHPMPSTLSGPIRDLLTYTGPEMAFAQRMVFGNLWLFGPVVERVLASAAATNASIRTTTAATVFQGGVKDNVLPSKARAVVNFRILPGDSIDGVIEHVRKTIDDPRIGVATLGWANEPTPVSSVESDSFLTLMRTIRQIFPDVTVAPSLVLGGTDSRHYVKLSDDVYRFVPHSMHEEDLGRVHGTNERIGVDNYAQIVRFYVQLMMNSDAKPAGPTGG